MTFDDKGRIIASDQYGSLYRVTLPATDANVMLETYWARFFGSPSFSVIV